MAIRYLFGAAILATIVPVGYASAQARDQEERPITLVGCVMTEGEYRDIYGPGLSGPRGPGIGLRNEYMLVDAREIASGEAAPTEAASCPAAPGTFPTAYELTGSREKEIAEYVGRRVVITGMQKEAKVRPVGTSGVLRPTGGFDPLGHELHLFEVELDTFRDVTATLASAAPAGAPAEAAAPVAPAEPVPAPEPEVAAAPPAPEPEVVAAPPAPAEPAPQAAAPAPALPAEAPRQVAQAELPRSASPFPLMGLIGILSLAAAAGVRSLRRA